MLRVKDPKVSLEWYERVLGMKLVNEKDGGSFTRMSCDAESLYES